MVHLIMKKKKVIGKMAGLLVCGLCSVKQEDTCFILLMTG